MAMILLVRDASTQIKLQIRPYVEVNNIDFVYLLVNVRQRARKKDKKGEGERCGKRKGTSQAEDSHHCGSSGILLVPLHSF